MPMTKRKTEANAAFVDLDDAGEFVTWMRTSDDVCELYEHVTGAVLKKSTPVVDIVDFLYAVAETLDESCD